MELTTKGTVITEPLDKNDVEAGSVCMIQVGDIFHRITLLHADGDGDWVVEGDYEGTVDRYTTFFRLSFANTEGNFPIGMKYWTRILRLGLLNDQKLHKFTIIPYKFKQGKSIQTCSECSASFKAAPSQPYCEDCCESMSTAHLTADALQKARTPSPRVDIPQVMQLTRIAYEMGKENKTEEEYIKWLEKKNLWP